jgi:hypothetical protein
MRDQKLLRSFCSVQNYQNRMNHDSFNNQHMEIAQENEDEDHEPILSIAIGIHLLATEEFALALNVMKRSETSS